MLSLGACSWLHSSSSPQVLRAGYNQSFPFVQTGKHGKPEGVAVEMLQRAADAAGIQLRWVYLPGSADEGFARKQIDIYPLMTITAERAAVLEFGHTWWEKEVTLVSPAARTIDSARQTEGKRIAAHTGFPQALAVKLLPKAQIVPLPEMSQMMAAMCAGSVDALFVDLRILQAQLLNGTQSCAAFPFHLIALPEGHAPLATAATRESARTAGKIFKELDRLSLDGTLSGIASKWGVFSSYPNWQAERVRESSERPWWLRWGMGIVTLALLVLLVQTRRLHLARVSAEASRRMADETQQRFDAFMTHTPAVTFIKDERGRLIYGNEAYCKQFQTTLVEMKGLGNAEVWPRDVAEELEQNDREVLTTMQSREFLEVVPDSSGDKRTFLSLKFCFLNSKGRRCLGGVAMDITDRKRAEEALRFSQFSIDRAPDMVFWLDAAGRITYANNAACRKLGFDAAELQSMTILDIDPTLTEARFRESRRELKKYGAITLESFNRTRDGRVFPVEISINYLEFDGEEFSCTMTRDITDRKRTEEELFQHARYDALTGLTNRRLFERHLDECVNRAQAGGGNPTVFYLDLDGFKLVNDTLGHAVGDSLLKQAAQRLKSCVREGDTLARMGGDEFTLISTNLHNFDEAIFVGRKLLASLKPPFLLANHELLVTASIGISRFPRDGRDASSLLQSADAAMYEAKHKGKNQLKFFTQQMREAAVERLDMEHNLRHAVERGEMELHFQPQVCLATGEILRYEALLRWNHPVMGMVPPAKFIPVAEDTFCIVPLGTWMLEQACAAAVRWNKETGLSPGVGVNISTVQFARPDFYDTLCSILDKTGLEPELLELELTESIAIPGQAGFADQLTRLRALGITMAIDDFGTGYSSLSYLQRLPFDVMKIDKSFAGGLTTGSTGLSLVRALVSLAHCLNMKVVMEGIETEGQLELVRGAGCDYGQGYLLGFPGPKGAPPESTGNLLTNHQPASGKFLNIRSIH